MDGAREFLPAAVVAAPFVAALVALSGVPRRWAEAASVVAALAATAAALALLPSILQGETPRFAALDLVDGIPLALRVDALGASFGLLAVGLWIAAAIYSIGYARATHLRYPRRFLACFAASVGAAAGIAYAENLLTFLLFYEILSVATYPLVGHAETPEALRAARRYLGYTLSAGLALTIATVWAWQRAGTLDFTPGGFLDMTGSPAAAGALFALFLFGCGVKAALMPFHAWLPAAMVAPTPVSALLHAVAVVKAGVFGCLRILGWIFNPEQLLDHPASAVLAGACLVTIVAGSVAALGQDRLKRRLAYSTVVHLSYIVLGGALLTATGMKGAILHLVNHGVAKITLFFGAGALYAAAHAERLADLRGLGRSMPWTCGTFTVASLALMGLPGLCGFVSKLVLLRGAVEAREWAALGILAAGSVFTAAYLVPILWAFWFEKPCHEPSGEAPALMVVPAVVTALLAGALGCLPAILDVQNALAQRALQGCFPGAFP
jgi:multicomponent Na+:H+ antiporter subunit D